MYTELAKTPIKFFTDIDGFILSPRYEIKGDNIWSKFGNLLKIWFGSSSSFEKSHVIGMRGSFHTFEMQLGKSKLYARQYLTNTKSSIKGDYFLYKNNNDTVEILMSGHLSTTNKSDFLSEIREYRFKTLMDGK